jgi:hypothetical protein
MPEKCIKEPEDTVVPSYRVSFLLLMQGTPLWFEISRS